MVANTAKFALMLNDLHNALGGGLSIEGVNIRLLLYPDDNIIVWDDQHILQRMIKGYMITLRFRILINVKKLNNVIWLNKIPSIYTDLLHSLILHPNIGSRSDKALKIISLKLIQVAR